MIDYIKYTIDGKTYSLTHGGNGVWSREDTAPSVAGNYSLLIEISENGIVSHIDSSDPRYDLFLTVLVSAERKVYLEKYVPEFVAEISELKAIYDAENIGFDSLLAEIEKIKSDMFILTSSNDAITRRESFLAIKGLGTLEQRKNYLISLNRKGKKLSEIRIKDITNAITGSDCIIKFFSEDEVGNPEPGQGLLRVQVLSPDNSKDYRYIDISRALSLLVPSHIKLLVNKYFATWGDVQNNFADWMAVASVADWQTIKDYIPPQ